MDKIRTIKLQMFSDPGHAWMRISRRNAEFLGILPTISAYSYQSANGQILYLEEDSDAPKALEALRARRDALPQWLNDKHTNKRSRVRSLPSYWYSHTTTIFTNDDLLTTRMNKVEDYIRATFHPSYTMPRPDALAGYIWGIETYYEVLETAIDYIREHRPNLYTYLDARKALIITNDRARMTADHAEKMGTFIFKSIR